MNTDKFRDRLAELHDNYLRTLPRRVMEIRRQWDACCDHPGELDKLAELQRMVHIMAGSGAAFGCQYIGETCQRIDVMVGTLIEGHRAVSAHQKGQIDAQMIALDLAVDRCLLSRPKSDRYVSMAQTRLIAEGQRSGLLYMVEDDPHFAEHLGAQLLECGYKVRVFRDGNALKNAVAELRPAAVIVDMILPEGKAAGADIVSQINAGDDAPIPAIFVTVRNDFEARLRAVRSGATHYFTKPVEIPLLVSALDRLSGNRAPDPYRILLVDDDQALTEIYQLYMEDAGLAVAVVNDPLAAVDAIEAFRPELIILDIYMPECSGLELAAVLRQQPLYDQIPIVFLTTEWHTEKRLAAMNLGGDDLMTKPVAPWSLVSSVLPRVRRAREVAARTVMAQNAVYELEQLRQALDEHAIVSATDADGNITYVNEKFCQLSGYARSELIGQNHRVLKSGQHPEDFYAEMWRTIASGRVWHGDVVNRNKAGQCYRVKVTIVPFDHSPLFRYISIRTLLSTNESSGSK